jgi:hypothetical protein
MQGFIDRRTEALRALDDLLDRLDLDDEHDEGDGVDEGVDQDVTLNAAMGQGSPASTREAAQPSIGLTGDDYDGDLEDNVASDHPQGNHLVTGSTAHSRDHHMPALARPRMGGVSAGGVSDLLARIAALTSTDETSKPGTERGEGCRHEGDPLSDLPRLIEPPSYRRGQGGVWRYSFGGVVPGARDDTLARRYRFAARPGSTVLVPVELCRRDDLLWVRDHHDGDSGAAVRWCGSYVPAYSLTRECWEARSRIPMGLTAPELQPPAMVDLAGFARTLGVRESSLSAYKARGRLPQPQFTVANSPLWSWPVIEHWKRFRLIQPQVTRPRRDRGNRVK